jgi:Pumilio-family RNA binding repeat
VRALSDWGCAFLRAWPCCRTRRFLQRKFDEGAHAAIALVFPEILEHLVELMVDPFGNYLIQKLLDRCSEEQRLAVLKRAAEQKELVNVALNTHGTRAVQKLIETLTSREQVQLVIDALRPGVVNLIRDLNGNHVIQRCLQVGGAFFSAVEWDLGGLRLAAAAGAAECFWDS